MTIDPRTIAADIMCGNARSITVGEIWAHIGQAYDTAEIDASIADEVAELIATAGIDLIWRDGSKDTELDAARVEIERRDAELAETREHLALDRQAVVTLREREQRALRLAALTAEQEAANAQIIVDTRAERDALMPVVEAAKAWRWSGETADGHRRAEAALMAAVDALTGAVA